MEKSLSLLSILIICGTTISSVIAASLNEKQEIEVETFNLRTEDNLGNLTRYKRQGEYDEIPDVSKHLRNLLNNYVIRINSRPLTTEDFSIDFDIKVKEIHEIIQRGVYETAPELVATESAIVRNGDYREQKMASDEIILKTTLTDTATISNTFDFTGEIEIPSIPVLGNKTKEKFGFKFSRSSTTTSTKSVEISKKLPSQVVDLEPRSCKKVVSELYASNIVSDNLISFEVDPSSTFGLQYIGFNSDLIWSRSSRKRILNLKEAVEEQIRSYDTRYPAYIYDGITPCIELKDQKMYFRYYPLERKSVKTQLFSHIEKIDDYDECLRMRHY